MKENSILFKNYETIEEVKRDKLFRWVKAKDLSCNKIVVLQLLILESSPDQVELLFDFFEKFQSASEVKLLRPDRILGNKEVPFAAVYKDVCFKPFSDAIINEPDKAQTWWEQVSEQLFYAHNKDWVHGYVSPENFIIANGEILLINFGYGPFIKYGSEPALCQVEQYCAPEVMSKHIIVPASDIFAFAKTVAYFSPELETTSWYRNATAHKPEDRPRRMRELFKRLQKEFVALESAVKKKRVIVEEKREEKPGLVRKYVLTAKAKPPEGGNIKGAGNYISSKTVTLIAIPSDSYIFANWSGDITGTDTRVSVTIDQDKDVVAVFIKDPAYKQPSVPKEPELTLFKLSLEAVPTNGGEVIGKGTYPENYKVEIKAFPSGGYRFDAWNGDLKSTKNPTIVKINSDKLIKARFSSAEKVSLNVSVNPPGMGYVRSKKDFVVGEKVRLRAIASYLDWKFDRWRGDIESSSNPISLLMDKEKHIVAHFKKGPWASLLLETKSEPPEGGMIKGGGRCPKGQIVSITAKANDGWEFSEWAGDYQGSNRIIRVTMDKEKSLIARFTKIKNKNQEQKRIPIWATERAKLSSNTRSNDSVQKAETLKSEKEKAKSRPNQKGQREQSPLIEKKQPKKPVATDDLLGDAFKSEIDRNTK